MSQSPEHYRKSIEELNSRFFLSIQEMTSSFPYAKAYPKVQSLQDTYIHDSGAFNSVQAELFQLKDGLQQDIDSTAEETAKLNDKIEQISKDNAKRMFSLSSLENQKQGAEGMYEDAREEYDTQYLVNVLMGVCALGVIGYNIKLAR